MKLAFVFALPLLLSACDSIPIVGLDQKTHICPAGQTAYVFQNARIGSCMSTRVVEFTHCVSELGLGEASSKASAENQLSVDALKKVLDASGITLSNKTESELKRTFSSGGPLEQARAEAVSQCTSILKHTQ